MYFMEKIGIIKFTDPTEVQYNHLASVPWSVACYGV